jgi:hypothetical protein
VYCVCAEYRALNTDDFLFPCVTHTTLSVVVDTLYLTFRNVGELVYLLVSTSEDSRTTWTLPFDQIRFLKQTSASTYTHCTVTVDEKEKKVDGDTVTAKILAIDLEKLQVSLTCQRPNLRVAPDIVWRSDLAACTRPEQMMRARRGFDPDGHAADGRKGDKTLRRHRARMSRFYLV